MNKPCVEVKGEVCGRHVGKMICITAVIFLKKELRKVKKCNNLTFQFPKQEVQLS